MIRRRAAEAAIVCLPPQSGRPSAHPFGRGFPAHRPAIEIHMACSKRHRRIATRGEHPAITLLGFVPFATVPDRRTPGVCRRSLVGR